MVTFVVLLLPETKGQDLEHTFKAFQSHWFWSKHSDIGEVHAQEEYPLKGRASGASGASPSAGTPDSAQKAAAAADMPPREQK